MGGEPRAHRLMMNTELACDLPVTHALFCQRQRRRFSGLIGLPMSGLRGEVQLTRLAAKTLTPSTIFPTFHDPRRLVTLRARHKQSAGQGRAVLWWHRTRVGWRSLPWHLT